MKILFSFGISVILFVVALVNGAQRAWFLSSAEKGTGAVESLLAENASCGSKSSRHDCTEYTAVVSFKTSAGAEGKLSVDAGNSRGHGQSVEHADLKVGSPVAIRYSPNDPSNAFPDNFWDIWQFALGSLMGSGMFLVSAVMGMRRR